jgi:hypothetical protein
MDVQINLPDNYPLLYATWTKLLDDKRIGEADIFSFEQLMPSFLGYLRTNQQSSSRLHYDGLISVLGFTPETVVLTSRLVNPETMVVLLYT